MWSAMSCICSCYKLHDANAAGCRFVCREQLGGNKQPAGYLTPVPENSVVYGSGSSSVILTKVPRS